MGRLSQDAWIRWLTSVFTEFFRAVPVLMMMFFAFAVYGDFGVVPPERLALAATVTGLTFYNGSVVAELVRSGVQSLPAGRTRPRLAVGLPTGRRFAGAAAAGDHGDAPVAHQPVGRRAEGHRAGLQRHLRQAAGNKASQIGNYKQNLIPAFMVVAALYIIINYLHRLAGRPASSSATRRRGRSAGGPIAPDQIDQAAVATTAAAANPPDVVTH